MIVKVRKAYGDNPYGNVADHVAAQANFRGTLPKNPLVVGGPPIPEPNEDAFYDDIGEIMPARYLNNNSNDIRDDIRDEMTPSEKGQDTIKRKKVQEQDRLAQLEEKAQERYRSGQYFVRSEAMELAFQLLKERVSPEAKRHKLEYDKQYESSPERVKYREDLNRERRRRGIYGSHDHKDVSHTKGGKLTLEGEHENRARHFKEKGTLRDLKMGGIVGHLVGAIARK